MDLKSLSILASNGNKVFVKTINDVRSLQSIGIDLTFTVPKKLENKIWSIAEILNFSDDIDVLLHINNLKPHILPAGTVLKIPDLNDYDNAIKEQSLTTVNQSTSAATKKKSSNQSIVVKSNGRLAFYSRNTK